jgi:hypothetical protein
VIVTRVNVSFTAQHLHVFYLVRITCLVLEHRVMSSMHTGKRGPQLQARNLAGLQVFHIPARCEAKCQARVRTVKALFHPMGPQWGSPHRHGYTEGSDYVTVRSRCDIVCQDTRTVGHIHIKFISMPVHTHVVRAEILPKYVYPSDL